MNVWKSYSSICLNNAAKRQVVDLSRSSTICSLRSVENSDSDTLKRCTQFCATPVATNIRAVENAHNRGSHIVIPFVSNLLTTSAGQSQIIPTTVETISLTTTRFPIRHSTRTRVNTQGCSSSATVASHNVAPVVSNPPTTSVRQSQIVPIIVETITSTRTRRFPIKESTRIRINTQGCNSSTVTGAGRAYKRHGKDMYQRTVNVKPASPSSRVPLEYTDLGKCTCVCRHCGAMFWECEQIAKTDRNHLYVAVGKDPPNAHTNEIQSTIHEGMN